MLLSSSEGFCLEGLVAAILLRAAMIAVVGIGAVPWVDWVERFCVGIYDGYRAE